MILKSLPCFSLTHHTHADTYLHITPKHTTGGTNVKVKEGRIDDYAMGFVFQVPMSVT